MSRISISYSVPVMVVVDLDSGRVERVVVIDEDVQPDPEGFAEDQDTYRPATAEQIEQAFAIADTDAEWPAWSHGW